MRVARFVVRGVPESVNATSGQHWQVKQRQRHEFFTLGRMAVAQALGRGAWDGRPFARARLTLCFFWPRPANRRDPLNYAGSEGVKGMVDALHPARGGELGAFPLVDDDFRHVEIVLAEGGVDRLEPRVEIAVEELPSL